MKNRTVIIIHGWDGNPDEPMLNWLNDELTKKDFEVITPLMPDPESPVIKDWINKIKETAKYPGLNTYFIGHSIGCQAVLRYLETLDDDTKIGGAVLIAPWMVLDDNILEEEGEEVAEIAGPWINKPVDWKKIKSSCDVFVCLFSDNDRYSTKKNFDMIKNNLSPKIIIEHDKGHYDPDSGITENQTALDELLRISG